MINIDIRYLRTTYLKYLQERIICSWTCVIWKYIQGDAGKVKEPSRRWFGLAARLTLFRRIRRLRRRALPHANHSTQIE